MSGRRLWILAAAGAGALAAAYFASAGTGYRFPHARHADAFSDCLVCHAGIPQGDRTAFYTVTREMCADCHEADVIDRVRWDDLKNPQGNLEFDHSLHPGNADAECGACHQLAGDSNPMAIDRPDPALCLDCHEGSAHLAADNDCSYCHRPLHRATDWTSEDIAGFPAPESHQAADFLVGHGEAAEAETDECMVCHTRDACEACHLNPEGAGVILRFERDSRVAALVASSEDPGIHPPGFAAAHRGAAGADSPRCESCHATNFCAECHEGSVTPEFHGANYLIQHPAEAYARDMDCASCHSTEVFCRDCHTSVGVAGNTGGSSSFHDAQPFWLLSHGTAARQGMDSCASCHQQNDCLECHSARGGWRVNPHGPDFDAETMGDKSPAMCVTCHFVVPGDD